MLDRLYTRDAQQAALGFLVSQTSYIEAEVYRVQYPEVQYPQLIPVDTSAPEWAKSVTYFSMDMAGRAQWVNHMATDFPLADVSREKFEQTVNLAAIGYRYTLEELGQAMMLGLNLTPEKAEAARRAYEEFVDDKLLRGDDDLGMTGLINAAGVTVVEAAEVDNASTLWSAKTGDEIIKDINDALTGVWTGSLQVEMANTILLPPAELARIATMARGANTDVSVLEWLMRHNIYTQTTGQPILIRAVRGLEAEGTGGSARMVVYRRDPAVLKAHIPMPHRFLPAYQTGPLTFDVPGIFRLAGLEIRRPGAVRYVDGIATVNLYE